MPAKLALAPPIGRRPPAPPSKFQCSWTDDGLDAAWVRLSGELDVATAPRLERLLREPPLQARVIVLDLRDLAFVDSSGVHAIVDASVRSRQAGRRMLLLRGRPRQRHPRGRALRPRAQVARRGAGCAMSATVRSRGAAESVAIEHETLDRVVRIVAFGVPPAALVAAGWLAWGGTLKWQDLLVLAITYTLSGLGV